MDNAMELVSVEATAPGGTAANFAAVAGNSLTIRDAKSARLLSLWGKRQSAGFIRITSPLIHDAVVGIQLQMDVNQKLAENRTFDPPQTLTPQDTLTVQGTGSGAAGDIEQNSFLVFYEDLAGICGKLISWKEVRDRGKEIYSTQNTIAVGVGGGYTGEELLNAEQDQLKANMDYAILGASASSVADTLSVRYRAPDWGNLGIGVPVHSLPSGLRLGFLYELSKWLDLPTIPVFNASQKDSVFIDALANENGTDPILTTHMVRLGSPLKPSKARRSR